MKIAMLSVVAAFLCLGAGKAELQGPAADLEFPFFRYVFWNDLTSAFKETAKNLDYNKKGWEEPFINDIEEKSWFSLTGSDRSNAAAMGYDEDVWDCYQNHYDDYDWSDMQEIGVDQYFKVLGWTKNSWDKDTFEPEPWDEDWVELTANQQAALKEICYFREEVWEEEAFADWLSFPPRKPRPDDLKFPSFRYVLWNDLTDVFRLLAANLEYTLATWQQPFANEIEEKSWISLGQADQSNAAAMGYDEDVWDCYQNHYQDHYWIELQETEVAQYFEVFGWTELTWDEGDDDPAAWELDWGEFTPAMEAAAKQLCYFQKEIWEGDDFRDWVLASSTSTPTASPTSMPSPLPTSSPSQKPTAAPSAKPILSPTLIPTTSPTLIPTASPTSMSSTLPSSSQSQEPTAAPSAKPIISPDLTTTLIPTASPTSMSSPLPTSSPSQEPTATPSPKPIISPNLTTSPTAEIETSDVPTVAPSAKPILSPNLTTSSPTAEIETSDASKYLQHVGNNKNPSSAYPLGECQGDCDVDEECVGGLVCFQRDGGDPVPGCLGGEDDNSRTDYCVSPKDLQHVGNNKNPSSAYPLGECQGDCDVDEECEGGLVCFQRDGGDPVPGCLGGEDDKSRTDYCVST
jgi:hypothetical protein